MQKQVDKFLQHLTYEKFCSANTIDVYRYDLKQLITFFKIKDNPVNSWIEVDEACVDEYDAHLVHERYGPATIARKVISLRSFFTYLLNMKVIQDNPAFTLVIPKADIRKPRVISVKDLRQLFSHSTGQSRAILETLYSTGMTLPELSDMRVDNLDLANGIVYCANRNSIIRKLPLSERTVDALRNYLENCHKSLLQKNSNTRFLFLNNTGKPFTRIGLQRLIKTNIASAGLSREITPRSFRHSFTARRIALGDDIYQLQKLLGYTQRDNTVRAITLHTDENIEDHCETI